MLLTQTSTPIIGQIAILLGYIMDLIYRALSSFGIENIGLCIIIFTFLIRMALLPLTIKQQRFTKINQIMQPEINKIQKKYRNKEDSESQQKMSQEIQAIYEKYGVSPTGGCLQLVIQLPIFFALYQVIRNIPAYIPGVKAQYMKIVTAISTQSGYIGIVKKIGKGLNSSYANSYIKVLTNKASNNQIIDVLGYYTRDAWSQLAKAIPNAADTITSVSAHIVKMNDFMFGINVAERPWHGLMPNVYWLLPIFAALLQYLSMRTMDTPEMEDNPAAGMTKSMTYMMPLMSLYFCFIMPAGLGIYWVASAGFQLIQQLILNHHFNNMDVNAMIERNLEKAEENRAKGHKTVMERMMGVSKKAEDEADAATRGVTTKRTISERANINTKKLKAPEGIVYDEKTKLASRDISNSGEITKNAYLVGNKDNHNNQEGKK